MKADYPWLKMPIVNKMVSVLGVDQIRFVGGCVRDSLLNRAVRDIDACTPLHPDIAMNKLVDAGLKVIPTGIDHGTITVVFDGETVELTTLRSDVSAINNRHAKVAFTDQWQVDAKRRDLTINAIYMDWEGGLFDPVGGVSDLQAKIVRFIGDPHRRIQEDALRIIRFFRFHAWFGAGDMDAEALQACCAHAKLIKKLSIERVRDELFKLLAADDPSPTLHAMETKGLLSLLVGEGVNIFHFEFYTALEKRCGLPVNPLNRLIALFGMNTVESLSHIARLKLSRKQVEHIKNTGKVSRLYMAREKQANHKAVYYYGIEAALAGRLLWGEGSVMADVNSLQLLHEDAELYFPVSGSDLQVLGVKTGPAMGDLLFQLEREWLNSGAKLTKEELLSKIQL